MSVRLDDVSGRVAVIALASPPANALGDAVIDGLHASLDRLEVSDARVLTIRSDVHGYFAAGADLKLLSVAGADGFADYLGRLRGQIERIASLPMISIAAIDGYALGGGLELSLACTLRVASPVARLGVPEVNLGLLPGAGGTQRLARLIGRGPALDLLLSGRTVDAEEALRIGLIDRIASEGTINDEVARWASALAEGPYQALAAIVRCVDIAGDEGLDRGMELEALEVKRLFASPDAREGIAAFLEKRQPRFQ